MANIEFTAKELESIKRLMQLGDSKELAEKTVLEARARNAPNPFYSNAYAN
jgi:hypothetical protein